VDLWDLTKLLLRRWYFAVPMLLASVVMVIGAAKTVEPDYSAKGYLQMIPPPGSREPENPNARPRPRNPWLDLGYEALGTAALLKVTDKAGLERLVKAGLSDDVTVLMSEDSPLFEIEAIGSSAAQATATVQEIIKRLNENVAESQRVWGVFPEDTITTYTVDDGRNVEVVTTKLKRILIVAAGLGVLLTAATTIGLDALLRRRGRRNDFPEPDLDIPHGGGPPPRMPDLMTTARPEAATHPGPPSPRRDWRDPDLGRQPPAIGPVLSLPASPQHERVRVTYEEPSVASSRSYADERRRSNPYLTPQNDAAPVADTAPSPIADAADAAAAADAARAAQSEPAPRNDDGSDYDDANADATIVLPLAYLSKRDDRRTKH
jgi:hypothetical protein